MIREQKKNYPRVISTREVLWTLLTKRNMLDICLDFMITASLKIRKNQEGARYTNCAPYP